jgi:hypothetical protein
MVLSQKTRKFLLSIILSAGIFFCGNNFVAVADYFGSGGALGGSGFSWSQGWSSGIFGSVGFGNFASGGVEGGAGILSEADMKLIVEALIDSYFIDANVDFATFLQNYVSKDGLSGKEVYNKMISSTKPQYYQSFMNYMDTPEGRLKASKELSAAFDVTLPASKTGSQSGVTTITDETINDIKRALKTGKTTSLTDSAVRQALIENGINPDNLSQLEYLKSKGVNIPSTLIASASANSQSQTASASGPDYDAAEKYLNSIRGKGLTADEVSQGLAGFGFTCANGICKEAGTNRVATGDGSLSSTDINSKYFWATEGGCLDGFGEVEIGGSSSPTKKNNESSETNTPPANTTCTSYTYSDWSACAGGVQSRSILHQYPSGCTDTATAVLTQNCTMPAVACTSYTYSDWSACVGGNQTRAIVSKLPSGCTDTATAVFTQACTAECTASQIPLVTNTTAATQSVNSATLSLITDRPAKCEYRENGGFTFGTGAGTDFKVTGSYNHNSGLTGVTAGAKTYYAVCKDATANCFSASLKIEFTAESASSTEETCADLTSNDRKNNANRSYFGTAGADSTYLWQAVETGTRDKFEKVDWYAGYQLTPEKDGKVNQLCGNFPAGAVNRVSLYDGSYEELAGAEITGDNFWRCVDIAPVQVKTDRRYYVLARIEDDPVYFEFKSGMLPKAAGNAVIEVGVRQSASSGDFGEDERKTYDHMIFGLVDVRISWAPQTLSGPSIASFEPQGNVDDDRAVLSVEASGAAECRFGREDVSYDQMDYPMNKTTTGKFTGKVCNLEKGAYTFYARCKDGGGAKNNVSAATTFTITQ